jgi:hypothetical protein
VNDDIDDDECGDANFALVEAERTFFFEKLRAIEHLVLAAQQQQQQQQQAGASQQDGAVQALAQQVQEVLYRA